MKNLYQIFLPRILSAKYFCHSLPSAMNSCDFNFLSMSPMCRPITSASSSDFLLLIFSLWADLTGGLITSSISTESLAMIVR